MKIVEGRLTAQNASNSARMNPKVPPGCRSIVSRRGRAIAETPHFHAHQSGRWLYTMEASPDPQVDIENRPDQNQNPCPVASPAKLDIHKHRDEFEGRPEEIP